ncbi:MAG TPA: ERF family protein [Pyrinomonadaceae bacterium]|nr:ERF family protein [Pyrinomonadaceae bacterium]
MINHELVPAVMADGIAIVPSAGDQLLAAIQAAASNNVNVDTIERLIALKMSLDAAAAKRSFAAAFRDAQAEMVPVVRDAENKHTGSRYALYETIDAAIRPIYTRHGFSMTFNSPVPRSGKDDITIGLSIMHVGGHSIEDYQLTGPLDNAGAKGTANKTDIQGVVSTVSYLRRVLECMAWNIVVKDEDKDGNSQHQGYITEHQVNVIQDLIAAASPTTDLSQVTDGFLRWRKIKTISDLRKCDYAESVTRLQAKARELREDEWSRQLRVNAVVGRSEK